MAKDPVCGMMVEESKAAARVEYRGTMYYFCSSGCHKAFAAEPGKYLQKGGRADAPAGEAATAPSVARGPRR